MSETPRRARKVAWQPKTWGPLPHRIAGDGIATSAMLLKAIDWRVYVVLAMRAARDFKRTTKVSNSDLKKLARVDDNQLRDARRALCKRGLLHFERADPRGAVYSYELLADRPATLKCGDDPAHTVR